jgi:hypothetical protein
MSFSYNQISVELKNIIIKKYVIISRTEVFK